MNTKLRYRWFNWLYAFFGGYFWLPCPLCHKKFGGHEIGPARIWSDPCLTGGSSCCLEHPIEDSCYRDFDGTLKQLYVREIVDGVGKVRVQPSPYQRVMVMSPNGRTYMALVMPDGTLHYPYGKPKDFLPLDMFTDEPTDKLDRIIQFTPQVVSISTEGGGYPDPLIDDLGVTEPKSQNPNEPIS